MRKSQFILAVSLLAGGVAFAGTYEKTVVTPQPLCGPFYASFFGGASFFDDVDGSVGGNQGARQLQSADFGLNNGWIAGAAIGVRTDQGWRFEAELNYQEGDIGAAMLRFVNNNPAPISGDFQGDLEKTSVMLNAVKEFGALQFLGMTPYLGAGLGISNISTSIAGGLDENVFAYQVMTGVVFNLTDCVQAYLEYRVSGSSDVEFSRDAWNGEGAVDLSMGWTQNALLGVRWFF